MSDVTVDTDTLDALLTLAIERAASGPFDSEGHPTAAVQRDLDRLARAAREGINPPTSDTNPVDAGEAHARLDLLMDASVHHPQHKSLTGYVGKNFDESKVHRDDHGKFASHAGGGYITTEDASKAVAYLTEALGDHSKGFTPVSDLSDAERDKLARDLAGDRKGLFDLFYARNVDEEAAGSDDDDRALDDILDRALDYLPEPTGRTSLTADTLNDDSCIYVAGLTESGKKEWARLSKLFTPTDALTGKNLRIVRTPDGVAATDAVELLNGIMGSLNNPGFLGCDVVDGVEPSVSEMYENSLAPEQMRVADLPRSAGDDPLHAGEKGKELEDFDADTVKTFRRISRNLWVSATHEGKGGYSYEMLTRDELPGELVNAPAHLLERQGGLYDETPDVDEAAEKAKERREEREKAERERQEQAEERRQEAERNQREEMEEAAQRRQEQIDEKRADAESEHEEALNDLQDEIDDAQTEAQEEFINTLYETAEKHGDTLDDAYNEVSDGHHAEQAAQELRDQASKFKDDLLTNLDKDVQSAAEHALVAAALAESARRLASVLSTSGEAKAAARARKAAAGFVKLAESLQTGTPDYSEADKLQAQRDALEARGPDYSEADKLAERFNRPKKRKTKSVSVGTMKSLAGLYMTKSRHSDLPAVLRQALDHAQSQEQEDTAGGLRVWYNQSKTRVAVDIMDWGDEELGKQIGNAAAKIIGKDSVIYLNEQGPPEDDEWIEVDYSERKR